MNPISNEDKIAKSLRNTKEFKKVLDRANKAQYDEDLDAARDNGLAGTSSRLPLLKVTELWTIRKHFSIEAGAEYYKLYKEKFYVENPGSNYFETVSPKIYRSVVAQKEEGDKDWADSVAAHFGIKVEADAA